jgi:periplasmic copper chaperone A
MNMRICSSLIVALLTAVATTLASGHAVLERKSAEAGSYYKGTFMLGHGCDGSPTTAVTVTVPDGIRAAKPQPKAGWTVEVRKVPLDKPFESHGRKVTERVSEVTWKGNTLDADHYDEFIILMRLPEAPGKMNFAVRQVCAKGEMNWAEVPAPGKTRRDYKWPAAELEVVPVAKAAELHKH